MVFSLSQPLLLHSNHGGSSGLNDGGDADPESFHQRAFGRQQVIQNVSGHPDHGEQADHESKHFAPDGVVVVSSIGNGSVLDEVEQEQEDHECGGDDGPA